jgi:hypothetical protein
VGGIGFDLLSVVDSIAEHRLARMYVDDIFRP